jgi:hypothetical protein
MKVGHVIRKECRIQLFLSPQTVKDPLLTLSTLCWRPCLSRVTCMWAASGCPPLARPSSSARALWTLYLIASKYVSIERICHAKIKKQGEVAKHDSLKVCRGMAVQFHTFSSLAPCGSEWQPLSGPLHTASRRSTQNHPFLWPTTPTWLFLTVVACTVVIMPLHSLLLKLL